MARQKTKGQKVSPKNLLYFITVVIIAVVAYYVGKGNISSDFFKDIFKGSDKAAVAVETTVHFIDVGQGDCTLVYSDGEAMLIDAGEKDCGLIVADYLDSLGITKLKFVVGTHPHSDHIGGLSYIVENYDVETVILPKVPDDMTPTTQTYEDLLEAVSAKGLKLHAARDEVMELGTSSIEFFEPVGDYSDLNDYSVCIKVIHGENSFLITGDTEEEAEENLVKRARNSLEAKVLKLGHHGSKTASSVTLLDAVNPRYAVISCGSGNKYGHPNEETLERVEKYADYIFRTDIQGTIIFESDGEGLNVVDQTGKNLLE